MSFWKKNNSIEESDDAFKKRILKEEERERLLQRQTRLDAQKINRMKKMEQLKKEKFNVEHPRTVGTISRLESGAKRVGRFIGTTAMESQKNYQHLKRQARIVKRQPNVQLRRTFVAPTGHDISMSSGIARNDWAGERNVMNTDFFGNNLGREFFEKKTDILGEQKRNLVSEPTNNLVSNNNNNKNKIRYI